MSVFSAGPHAGLSHRGRLGKIDGNHGMIPTESEMIFYGERLRDSQRDADGPPRLSVDQRGARDSLTYFLRSEVTPMFLPRYSLSIFNPDAIQMV